MRSVLRGVPFAAFAAGLALLAAPAAASAHGLGAPPHPPSDAAEQALRAVERARLGATHAAAHARQRELARRLASVPAAALRRRGGPRAAAADPAPAVGGSWAPAVPLPVIAINAILLPTGKVLLFAYPARPGHAGYEPRAEAYVWDPVSGGSTRIDPPIDPATGMPTNIWCGGASLMADGRVLVTGGNVDDPLTDFHGLDAVFVFDPFTETWQPPGETMRQGRWYPSQLLMADGRTLVMGGLTRPGDRDFGPGGGTNRDVEVVAADGSVELLADLRLDEPGAPPSSPLYPRLFWMPSGRALVAGPRPQDSWWLAAPRAGVASSWADAPDLRRTRDWSTAVLLEGGRVLTLGGSRLDAEDGDADGRRGPLASSELLDEDDVAGGWRDGPPLAVGRSHANSVLLPDGSVATVGGGFGDDSSTALYRWLFDDDQRRVELLDPDSGEVALGAAQAEGRTYHSSALLLPDGRVLSAGDDVNGPPTDGNPTGAGTGTSSDTAELYSPPYLHRGPRPVLGSVPAVVAAGDAFDVTVAGPAATRAVLVAPGASTHSTDMSQRIVTLAAPVAGAGGALTLRAPADADVAPPGFYMLFALSADGVPSIARFVRLAPARPTAPPPPAPPPPPLGGQPPPGGGGGGAPPRTLPRLTLAGRLPGLPALLRDGRFRIVVGSSQAGAVRLTAGLERRRGAAVAIAAPRTVRLPRGGRRSVTIALTAAGRRLLARRRGGTTPPRRRGGVVRIGARMLVARGGRAPRAIHVRRLVRPR